MTAANMRRLMGFRNFDDNWVSPLADKLVDPKYEPTSEAVDFKQGHEVNVLFVQKHGFKKPIFVEKCDGLQLRVPPENFSVRDVETLVGGSRRIDVLDVRTQKGEQMLLSDFVRYYTTPASKRRRLLNLLSLEFSYTPLSDLVVPPSLVREIDWVDVSWPPALKRQQTESTNLMDTMKFPKVQKYCLMSVASCYTDFHIDLGGSSVWYHVIRGEKVFWLIPPTEENILLFTEWTLEGKQHLCFFGDLVQHCYRIRLKPGNTFFIPSGWIHGVYTPEDALVFGGNFLHSYAMPMQLNIYRVEDTTYVPSMLRYPYFMEHNWYTAERYVWALTGQSFLDDAFCSGRSGEKKEVRLTCWEVDGLCVLYDCLLERLSGRSRNKHPPEIKNPKGLLAALKEILRTRSVNEHELALTGVPVLKSLTIVSAGKATQDKFANIFSNVIEGDSTGNVGGANPAILANGSAADSAVDEGSPSKISRLDIKDDGYSNSPTASKSLTLNPANGSGSSTEPINPPAGIMLPGPAGESSLPCPFSSLLAVAQCARDEANWANSGMPTMDRATAPAANYGSAWTSGEVPTSSAAIDGGLPIAVTSQPTPSEATFSSAVYLGSLSAAAPIILPESGTFTPVTLTSSAVPLKGDSDLQEGANCTLTGQNSSNPVEDLASACTSVLPAAAPLQEGCDDLQLPESSNKLSSADQDSVPIGQNAPNQMEQSGLSKQSAFTDNCSVLNAFLSNPLSVEERSVSFTEIQEHPPIAENLSPPSQEKISEPLVEICTLTPSQSESLQTQEQGENENPFVCQNEDTDIVLLSSSIGNSSASNADPGSLVVKSSPELKVTREDEFCDREEVKVVGDCFQEKPVVEVSTVTGELDVEEKSCPVEIENFEDKTEMVGEIESESDRGCLKVVEENTLSEDITNGKETTNCDCIEELKPTSATSEPLNVAFAVQNDNFESEIKPGVEMKTGEHFGGEDEVRMKEEADQSVNGSGYDEPVKADKPDSVNHIPASQNSYLEAPSTSCHTDRYGREDEKCESPSGPPSSPSLIQSPPPVNSPSPSPSPPALEPRPLLLSIPKLNLQDLSSIAVNIYNLDCWQNGNSNDTNISDDDTLSEHNNDAGPASDANLYRPGPSSSCQRSLMSSRIPQPWKPMAEQFYYPSVIPDDEVEIIKSPSERAKAAKIHRALKTLKLKRIKRQKMRALQHSEAPVNANVAEESHQLTKAQQDLLLWRKRRIKRDKLREKRRLAKELENASSRPITPPPGAEVITISGLDDPRLLELIKAYQASQKPPRISQDNPYVENSVLWTGVFSYLSQGELTRCALVCHSWHKFSSSPKCWRRLHLGGSQPLSQDSYQWVIDRQPRILSLSHEREIPAEKLAYLLGKLSHLEQLNLPGSPWHTLQALSTALPPTSLRSLDLRWMKGCDDESFRSVFSGCGQLRAQLSELLLAGCDIGDPCVRFIANQMPRVEILDLSFCPKVSDVGVACLVGAGSRAPERLRRLHLAGCGGVSIDALKLLQKLRLLDYLDLSNCGSGITAVTVAAWVNALVQQTGIAYRAVGRVVYRGKTQ